MVTNNKRYMRMYMRKYRASLRFELFEQLGMQCVQCGCGDLSQLEFHHLNGYNGEVSPNGSRGGMRNLLDIQKLINEGRASNVVVLCKRCNKNEYHSRG